MYKHHSYNNLVERKLEQLPAADTDGLWSNMEAILDQQMPQKKRRPGLWGWLFTHKAWMVATLVVGTAAGTSVVYFKGSNSPAAQQATLPGATAPRITVTAPAVPSGEAPTAAAADAQKEPLAPVPKSSDASTITTINPIQNTSDYTAAPAPVPASTQNTTTATDPTIASAPEGTRNTPPVAMHSNSTPSEASNGAEQRSAAESSQPLQWAATTRAIAAEQHAAPAVDPAAVRLDTKTLEQLSQNVAAASAAAHKMGRLPQEKGPYVGVVAGLDLSSVEFGSMESGNNKGFIAGYAFNNRWSVESGLLWSRKNYSADGSYYKADGYVPQPGVTILNVDGRNQLFEWPVNLKYNLLEGRDKLFTTAGISSYFISRESLSVDYNFNGQPGTEYHQYSDLSKHWFSVASFSVGYSRKLGSFGSLRVEPYVKLPLRDLGVGNMRVTSTGLNVGFIKMLRQ